MNYNRVHWDRLKKKRNPYAAELEDRKYRPRIREPKPRKEKLNPRIIERLIDEQDY